MPSCATSSMHDWPEGPVARWSSTTCWPGSPQPPASGSGCWISRPACGSPLVDSPASSTASSSEAGSSGTAAHRTARVVYSQVIEETFARHLDEHDLVTLAGIAQKLLDRLGSGRDVRPRHRQADSEPDP